MRTFTKKKAADSPIENLLKKSPLLPTDANSISACMERLQSLRQVYMEQNKKSRSAFSLPTRKSVKN